MALIVRLLYSKLLFIFYLIGINCKTYFKKLKKVWKSSVYLIVENTQKFVFFRKINICLAPKQQLNKIFVFFYSFINQRINDSNIQSQSALTFK